MNVITKKNPYLLTFIDEVLNIIAKHDAYSFFLDGYSRYHHISITLEDEYKIAFVIDWGVFTWVVMPFGVKNGCPNYQRIVSRAFRDYLDKFTIFSLNDLI